MTEENLIKGLDIKRRINELEIEIDFFLDYIPPTRENIKEKGKIGYKATFYQRVVGELRTFLKRGPERTDPKIHEIEVTNEDIRTLMEIRIQEQKNLKKELEDL